MGELSAGSGEVDKLLDGVLLECLWSQDATWNGSKMNAEAASDIFGADDVYPLSEVRARPHLSDVPFRASFPRQIFNSCRSHLHSMSWSH